MKSTHSSAYEHFLAELRRLRKKTGVTQEELARRLGRPQSFVSKYEIGERRLDIVEFLELMAVLKVDPVRFIANYMKDVEQSPAWRTSIMRGRKRTGTKA